MRDVFSLHQRITVRQRVNAASPFILFLEARDFFLCITPCQREKKKTCDWLLPHTRISGQPNISSGMLEFLTQSLKYQQLLAQAGGQRLVRWSLKRDLKTALWQADVCLVEQSGLPLAQQGKVRMRLFVQ